MAAPNLVGLPPEQSARISELRDLLVTAPESVARGLVSLFRKVTFHVARSDELEEAQEGYSFNP
jgi:hypothetical protein